MEALVIKVLKKHFKLFIKNFKAEQLSVYASKGEGQMTDLDLNEGVIQELLYIPMNLTVTKASCDLLTLKIPWTSLSSKPVTLTLNRIDIDLREPEEIKPPTSFLKKLESKKKKSGNNKSDVLDNAQLVVNSVHITIQTLGGSLLMVDLEDIVIQSTNGKWEVVDLSLSRSVEKDLGQETLYKRLSVRAITVALLTEKSAHMILQQMPLQIQITQKRRIKDAALLAAEIAFVLEDVKFRWTRPEWLLMVDLARGFQMCLSRPVPEAPPTPVTTPTSPPPLTSSGSSLSLLTPVTPDIAFSLRLGKWSFDFVESLEENKGYSFFGGDLSVVFNSAKSAVLRASTDKTVEEAVISITVTTVNFRELAPRRHIYPFIVSNKDQLVDEAISGQSLLKATLILRRPTEETIPSSPGSSPVPLIGIELSLQLSNLQIVADRRIWKSLIKFVGIPRTELEKLKKKKEKEEKKEKKEDALTIAQNNLTKVKDALKLGEDWFNQIKLNIKASDIRLVLPQEEKGLYQNVSLHLDLGNFTMGNFSDWKITPNLSKGIALLAAPSPAPPVTTPKTTGVPQKLTFQIEGVSVALHSSGRVANLLAPTGVKLFVHYYEKETKGEKGRPNLEVIFQSGEFNLQANEHQFKYLAFVGRKYLNPRKIKSALSVQVEEAKQAAKEKLEEAIKELQDSTPKEDLVTPIGQKVQSTLDAYKWVVYIHFNKGVFRVPLQFFLSPDAPAEEPAAPATAPAKSNVVSIADTPLFAEEEPMVAFTTTRGGGPSPILDELLGGTTDSCELKYEGMDLAFENNVNGQGACVQLSGFQATGLDHPKLPSTLTLLPLISDQKQALEEVEALIFRYKRRRKQVKALDASQDADPSPDDDYFTDVWFRLQGMQVKITSKPNHPGIQTGMGLPDIQALVNKAVGLLQERQSDIDVIRQNASKINTNDVKWGVEVGNCEVMLEKQDENTTAPLIKPYGIVRFSDAQRHSLSKGYFDLEDQLVKAKSNLAMKEIESEDYQNRINSLESALMSVETDKIEKLQKLSDELSALEAKFVQAKVTIAQQQTEQDDLKSQINKLKKK